ncbi:hypothetical protein KTD15_06555 [Burkholderia multivorans]|uniref:hypothetical protein n=1 Tax=Burkholderia multivorans TaxID=87883 RepID=UPI001C22B928|nr:hypothetical protein [Burkholderia multivorans]MBU9118456.1 hypothetical protein [Burkholderia multivorans]
MDKLAMAQSFSKKLVDNHRAEQIIDIIISNRHEDNVGVCHSHDYCDANMLMLEVFEENNLSIEDESNHALWNEVWDLAKKNEFFYKMSQEKAREYLAQFKDSKIADIYDDYPTLREALLVLIPDFEYPDHSYKKVSQLLK